MKLQTVGMASKKGNGRPGDKSANFEKYRKHHKQIRLRGRLAAAAEQRADVLEQDVTQYVNDAVRMRLESEGCWPPPSAG